MRRCVVRLLGLGLVALSPLAPRPARADESVLWVSWIKPRRGMEQEFEAGLAAHHRWRREQKDPWSWIVWRIGSGPLTGSYAVGTFNHRWTDFDAPPVDPEKARSNFRLLVEPFVESTRVEHYSFLAALSHSPATMPPRRFSVTEVVEVEGGREREFLEAINSITRAIKRADWPIHYEWFRLETGGEQPTYARVRILWSWDDLKEPELSLRQVLVAAYGEEQAEAIARQFHQAVRRRHNRVAVIKREHHEGLWSAAGAWVRRRVPHPSSASM